jgi:hypothetical protein
LPPDVEEWTLHDLRRTFASGCARLGIAVHVVEAALNHRSGMIKGVAAVYNRYSYDAEKRAAMTAWARHVEAIVSGANVVELAIALGKMGSEIRRGNATGKTQFACGLNYLTRANSPSYFQAAKM